MVAEIVARILSSDARCSSLLVLNNPISLRFHLLQLLSAFLPLPSRLVKYHPSVPTELTVPSASTQVSSILLGTGFPRISEGSNCSVHRLLMRLRTQEQTGTHTHAAMTGTKRLPGRSGQGRPQGGRPLGSCRKESEEAGVLEVFQGLSIEPDRGL